MGWRLSLGLVGGREQMRRKGAAAIGWLGSAEIRMMVARTFLWFGLVDEQIFIESAPP